MPWQGVPPLLIIGTMVNVTAFGLWGIQRIAYGKVRALVLGGGGDCGCCCGVWHLALAFLGDGALHTIVVFFSRIFCCVRDQDRC